MGVRISTKKTETMTLHRLALPLKENEADPTKTGKFTYLAPSTNLRAARKTSVTD